MSYPYMNMNMPPYPYPTMRTSANSINWVQGTEGAKAFSLKAGENVVLMDSESDNTFFIKICDEIGRCSLRTFEYHEKITESHPVTPVIPDMSEYVKKSELEPLINKMLGGTSNESTVSRTESTK